MAKLMGWDDTIVALATPPGIGAIGVIRISGTTAIAIADRLFTSKNLQQQPSHTLHVGLLKSGGEVLDEVVVSLYKAPRSYTGEDVVEISCHGSPFVQQKVMEAIAAAGARLAKPGEFTQRAFLNGKLDLTQAEAVADVIASNTEASRNAALNNIRGGFSSSLKALREQLIKFSALIELELDFSQEDVEFADRTQLYSLINDALQQVQILIASFALGNVIKNGVQVAIIGKPNAGKSTLLNTLLNEERAIVSDIAGTTRDTIEEVLNIQGILFRLIDTAGIRESKGDVIEDIGIEKSKANAEKADIIIHLVDLTDGLTDKLDWLDAYAAKTLTVFNKADVVPVARQEGVTYISAREKEAGDTIKQLLYHKAMEGKVTANHTIVTNAQHHAALQKVLGSLVQIKEGMNQQLPGDLLALDIRHCLHYLGEITGEITNEDQLDYIFSKFCIGK
jgi:tRNA modification GTPase